MAAMLSCVRCRIMLHSSCDSCCQQYSTMHSWSWEMAPTASSPCSEVLQRCSKAHFICSSIFCRVQCSFPQIPDSAAPLVTKQPFPYSE